MCSQANEEYRNSAPQMFPGGGCVANSQSSKSAPVKLSRKKPPTGTGGTVWKVPAQIMVTMTATGCVRFRISTDILETAASLKRERDLLLKEEMEIEGLEKKRDEIDTALSEKRQRLASHGKKVVILKKMLDSPEDLRLR